jgi:tetratricopeptide (TPR) repeat protein
VCYDHDTPGRPADAVSEFQTAMSLGDHRLGTYAYLAESLSDSGHTDQAIHWAKQGVAIYHSVKDGSPPGAVPDATFICAALAYVYQNAGRNADAVTAGEEALAIDPNDVGTNEALGDAYFALGQRHKARIAWQIVARDGLEEDPEGIGHARAMLVKYPENGT